MIGFTARNNHSSCTEQKRGFSKINPNFGDVCRLHLKCKAELGAKMEQTSGIFGIFGHDDI